MSRMKYRPINGINKKASILVYGTGNNIVMGEDADAACECLDMAYEMGFTVFDTAYAYGNAEKNLGIWMARRGLRDKVIILDKGCNPGMKGSDDVMTPKLIREQVSESLDRLGTEYTDMYILHRDDIKKPVGDIVEVLNELRKEEKIICFGGSNWTYVRTAEANRYAKEHDLLGFTVASPCYNMIELKNDPWGGSVCISGRSKSNDRSWYKENNITVFPYSSLGRGFLSGKYNTQSGKNIRECLPEAPISEYYHPDNIAKLKKAEELAAKKKVTVSQIALAWLLSDELNVYPIVSPSKKSHMEDNIGSFEVELTEDERKWLSE